MFFRLSNAADLEQVEAMSGLPFKHPNLYRPRMLIDGLLESSISIITMNDPGVIDFAIWGLMPNGYKEDWLTFQNSFSSLNFSLDKIKDSIWIHDPLKKQRSLIIVSGFFTYLMKKGKLYPYYISLQNEQPFYLGSIYSTLEDGFLSTGLLTTNTDNFIKTYNNLSKSKPLILPESVAQTWLDPATRIETIKNIIQNPPKLKLRANPIASEFFKKNILYDSLLNPVHYEGLPEGTNFTD